jgi:hypothetical protein
LNDLLSPGRCSTAAKASYEFVPTPKASSGVRDVTCVTEQVIARIAIADHHIIPQLHHKAILLHIGCVAS